MAVWSAALAVGTAAWPSAPLTPVVTSDANAFLEAQARSGTGAATSPAFDEGAPVGTVRSLTRLAALIAISLLAACAPVGGAGHDAALLAFAEAQNRGDPATAAALFAPDGLYLGVMECSPVACVGRVAIEEALENEAVRRTSHLLHPRSPLGGGRTRDEVRWASMEPLADRAVYDVALETGPDGITALRFAPDRTDAQTARVLAATDVWRNRVPYDGEQP